MASIKMLPLTLYLPVFKFFLHFNNPGNQHTIFHIGMIHQVIYQGSKILQHLENEEIASAGYKSECMYWIAEILRAQEKRSEALKFAEMALAQSRERNADEELEGPFENFREIKYRLENLHRVLKGEELEFFEDRDLPVG